VNTRVALIGLVACVVPASAQIHLIVGSPTPKSSSGYSSAVYRLASDGTIQQVANLVADSNGVDWIAVSQNARKAVVVAKGARSRRVLVIDLDKAALVKQCSDPSPSGAVSWLLESPEKGLVYAQATGTGTQAQIHGMILDPAISCDHSFVNLDPLNARYIVATGQAGIAGVGGFDWMQVGITKDGTVAHAFGQGVVAYFEYRVPLSLFADLKEPSSMVVANNKRLFALSTVDFTTPGSYRLLIFRKSDNTWLRMPDVGESVDCERAFGEFIAAAAAIRKRSGRGGESAGAPEWRKEEAATGPAMTEVFAASYATFPGRLYLYDVATEHMYRIATNQADSEILLVEDGVVYYRASDRLYSSTITANGLTPGRLLATSDVIRDAHWAFIKH